MYLQYPHFLRDGVTTKAAIRLILRRNKPCLGVGHIRHVIVVRRRGGHQGTSLFHSTSRLLLRLDSLRLELLGKLFLFRSLDKATLDAESAIRQTLAAVVANLLVPVASRALVIVSSDNGCAFRRRVDSNAAILVVHL